MERQELSRRAFLKVLGATAEVQSQALLIMLRLLIFLILLL
jgi:hypothetical protein